MADELHAVVRLLLKRMESHPEEFTYGVSGADGIRSPLRGINRWDAYLQDISEGGNEAEKAAIHKGLREIRLGEIHERVMDELINGEQRRADERRAFEEEQKRYNTLKQQTSIAQQYAMSSGALAAQQNAISGAQITGLSMAEQNMSISKKQYEQNLYDQLKKALGGSK
jgi:hypothetical protein